MAWQKGGAIHYILDNERYYILTISTTIVQSLNILVYLQ
jgi:hypothetical protein